MISGGLLGPHENRLCQNIIVLKSLKSLIFKALQNVIIFLQNLNYHETNYQTNSYIFFHNQS